MWVLNDYNNYNQKNLELTSSNVNEYRESPEISPGLICGERPFSENKIDRIYKTMILTVGTWSNFWGTLYYAVEILILQNLHN